MRSPSIRLRTFLVDFPLLPSLLLAGIAVWLVVWGGLWRLDWLFYDWHLRFWEEAPPDDIVIVGVDEYSLKELGRWPWPRKIHAALVDKLTQAGAKAIAFDMIFAEPSTVDAEDDATLARAIANSGRVILPVLPEQLYADGPLTETLPIPLLRQAAAGLGHVDVELDADGIVRSAYLKAGLNSPRWPALGLALLELTDGKLTSLPGQRAPAPASPGSWARDYRFLVHFAGPPGHLHRIAYVDVLNGNFPTGAFQGKLVMVGATAAGLGDNMPTPVSGQNRPMPGVEFNANVLGNLLNLPATPVIIPLSDNGSIWLTGLIALLPFFIYSYLPPRWTLWAAVALVTFSGLLSIVLLREFSLWFPPAVLLATLLLSYPLWIWRRLIATLQNLFIERERSQVTLHSIGDGVITTDSKGIVEYLNPIAETLTGYPLREALGRPLVEILRIVNEHSRAPVVSPVMQCLEAGGIVKLGEENIVLSRSGQEYAIRASASPMRNESGSLQGVVLAINDISEARLMAQKMAYQATHDALTELPNRSLLLERLDHAMARASHSNELIALLAIDLDRFKAVNDALGYNAGDALLRAVATRLDLCLQEGDTLARLEGDKFGVLLEHVPNAEEAVLVAQYILETLEEPHFIFGHELFANASIGISLFPKDGESADMLLKNADIALSRAKENGRNTFQFYAQDMNNWMLGRLLMERDLRRALERGELELYYQPQLELKTGRIVSAETLLRWRHPEMGMISPGRFVPLAEETGLIVPIGEWVISQACRQVQAWKVEGLRAPRVAINLSPRQFMQPGLSNRIDSLIRESGLDVDQVELEITESMLMKDIDAAIAILQTLKDMGIQLALDDFGTGYSSFNYLKRFPLDWLKVDQSFVRDITTDSDDAAAIVSALIAVAHSLRLGVIAEGVETAEQLEFLRSRECELIQGFFISRPLSLFMMDKLVRANQS
ncbi:MAG: EAL domain-containing protein [Gammaproteobacteria bacterium]|nr:EAL domain-containing protein [Gammaproteobacteria bacterium]MCP5425447.1 EAL domain-containing protein [Gammaproteobacteria bacterium]MCP5459796.1 EAL domain-containing protein [Gammaproteobacteria bacterium]